MKALSVLCLALMLAACASTPAPAPASDTLPPPVKQVCIPVTPWTMQQEADLANALAPIPQTSPIWAVELDWQKMRDEANACLKAQH